MGARLRGSGAGARWYGLVTQLVFAGAIVLGLLNPDATQTALDRSLEPLLATIAACLVVLAIRTLFVGVYFLPDRLVVRSWFRTYTVPLDASARCDTEPWSSFLTGWNDSRTWRMLRISWTEAGRRRTRGHRVTVAGRNHARQQAAVINAFISAAADGPTPNLARDYARGQARRAIVAEKRAHQKSTVFTGFAWLGLVRHPEPTNAEASLGSDVTERTGSD